MTSKERVIASLNRKPDGIPIDFGSTGVTGMHVSCVAALRDYYGLEKRPVKAHEPYQMLGLLEEDLLQAMGVDVQGVFPYETMFGFLNENWKPWRMDNGLEVLVSEHFKTTKDEKADTLIYPQGDTSAPPSARMPKNGYFFDAIIRQPPINEDKLDPSDNLEEFGPIADEALEYFAAEAKKAAATGRFVIANFGGTGFGDIALVPAPFLKYPKGIRDIEEWYISTLTHQDYIRQVFEKQCNIASENLAKIKEAVGDIVDAIFVCGTDFGTQRGTFCSEETFRSLYMPYYKRINDWVHKETNWKTFKHTCGAISAFIPALIESGFDILNPVQTSAAGMDPEYLKNEYGNDIVFWGGGVDTQKTLPFSTPQEVKEEVLRRCEIFGRDGGFVFNTIHNILANTPIKNIVAMIDAVKQFNGS